MAPRVHRLIRLFALIALAASLTYMAQRSNVRRDMTAEGLSQLSQSTRDLIASVDESQPVIVTAYVSKEVPRPYVDVRARLLNVLREMEASGGAGLTVRIYEPEPFSVEAEEAIEKFGIMPRPLVNAEAGKVDTMITFLGVAFTSGPREEVVPFLDRGLSVEYELARALQVVIQDEKQVIGIMRDDTRLMGDFDLQARRRIPPWQIVAELEKQYEVRTLMPDQPIPPEVDVLLVPQLSSQSQAALDVILAYLLAGRPALLLADPMPFFNLRLSPNQPMLPPPQQQGMMAAGGEEPKGNYRELLRAIGVDWQDQNIAFDLDNPEAQLADAPRNVVVVGQRSNWDPFAGKGRIVEGLAQVVVLFGGDLRPAESGTTDFAPLLVTGSRGGWDSFGDMTDDSNFLFGIQFKGVPSNPTTRAADKGLQNVVLGARITGGGSSGGQNDINAIVLADLDMFADTFFSFHERGGDLDDDGLIDLRFDNVTFLLNCIDDLLGDERFIELRKRQPKFRRLSKVDDMTEAANTDRQDRIKAANDEAKTQLEAAQKSLDEAVAAIKAKTDLDETTKQIMIRSAEEAENRRLQAQTEAIDREKAKAIDKIKAEHARAIDEVRDRIRVLAILLPPIPAILLGLVIFYRKRRRESATIPEARKRKVS
jgi:ABC-2 type transport system permease protein